MYASDKIPKRLQHKRWCRNASIPDAWLPRQAAACLCHVAIYRRKIFMTACAPLDSMTPGVGPTAVWRSIVRTGLAVSELRFRIVLGLDITAGGAGAMPNTHLEISVQEAGGATVTKSVDYGSSADSNEDVPSELGYPLVTFDVSPTTVYYVTVNSIDGARPIAVTGYEWANPTIDDSRPPLIEIQPSVFQPVLESLREALLDNLSDLWLNNGIHLMSWSGLGTGSARTQTGTTWLNVHDGTSTSVTAATPGYYFGAEGAGDGALTSLLPWVRLKDSNDLPVTFAAYGDVDTGNTGEVRLVDSGGAGVTLSGLTTTDGWFTTDTTLSNVDAIASSGKLDLQIRNGTAGQITRIYAAAMWTRAA